MKEHRSLAWPLYLAGLLLIAFPLVDFAVTIAPLSPSILSWRFGAAGMLSRSLLTPTLGLVVIFATATVFEHPWAQRSAMVLGFLGGAALLAVLGLFALDVVQFRHQVRAEALTAFKASSVVAAAKLLAAAVVSAAVGASGLRMARHAARLRAHGSAQPAVLVRPGHHEEREEPAPVPPPTP